MNKILLTLATLLLWVAALSAQNNPGTISGEVRDSKGPLPGASVFLIKDLKTQEIVESTISGSDGKFTLSAPQGEYALGVSFLGYALHVQKVHITPGTKALEPITLQESFQELQTVVVQGKAIRVRTQADGYSVNVKELRNRTNDALDLLKLIPKVQVKGEQLSVIGKEKVLVKIGNVLQRVDAADIASVLKGYDAGLIDKVEVITQPPLRYDPDGNTAMIVLHTSSIFKEYMGGMIGSEEMWGSKENFRFGGYGSLLYNHRGLYASIAPSINFNGSEYLEQQAYQSGNRIYKVYTPSTGRFNYMGIRGNLQYDYGDKELVGLAFAWNQKKYNNQFFSKESVSMPGAADRIVENQFGYRSAEPRFTATAYWETAFGERSHQVWTELSYVNLSNQSRTDYAGQMPSAPEPFLVFTEGNAINTSGLSLNNDYAFYFDSDHKYLLETGVKGSWSFTTNFRTHDDSKSVGTPIHQKNRIRWDELIVSPYVSSTLRFNKQWWMRVGVRYAGTQSILRQMDKGATSIPDVSTYNDAWLPTLHASYKPSSRHQITLTLNSGIVRPKFKDLNPFVWHINERTFYKGNTRLRPYQFYTSALGYTFRNALYIRGRVKRELGIITSVSTLLNDNVYKQVENAQNSLFVGLEAGYYFDKLSWMTASIDGYYGRNKYTSNNPNLAAQALSNEWGVNGYMEFTFNKSRTWTGYISGDYTGRKHTTEAIIEPQYDLGMGMSYYLLKRRLALSIAGINLLSSSYKGVSPRDGYTITFNNRYNYPTLYFSISYKFSNGKDKSNSRVNRATQDLERRF